MCIGGPSKYCGTEGTAKMISVFDVNVGNMGLMHILLSFVSTENQRAYLSYSLDASYMQDCVTLMSFLSNENL
jgi:hypothetical protein